tara:strand:- start:38 stop:868 length:831 start_codon:yes stop_codon:yes gene_type:complete
MRRGKLSNKSIFYIILAGFFTLSSYFFDQQVIQKEDKIRDQSLVIEKLYQDISQENTNWVSTTMLGDRVLFKSHQASSFSTINYKIHLLINNQHKFIDSFDADKLKKTVRANMYLNYIDIRDNILDLRDSIDSLSFSQSNYDNEEVRNKVINLFTWDDTFFLENKKKYFNQKIFLKVKDNSLTLDNKNNFMRALYAETNKLNKIFFSNIQILEELGDFYYDQEELLQAKYDTIVLDQGAIKIQKNYFILLSILFQILSLLSFLLLFRNFINSTFIK